MTEIEDVYLQVTALRDELLARFPEPDPEAPPPPRRRISKDEILAAHLAAMNRPSAEHSSVRIARNARGETQFEVVVRSGDSAEIVTAADAMNEARRLYDVLDEAFQLRKAASDE